MTGGPEIRHLARRGPIAVKRRPLPSATEAQAPFIGQFAAHDPAASGLPWEPSTEADVDANNALETAPSHQPVPASDGLALPCGARWRQRDSNAETREHVELPLDAADGRAVAKAPAPQQALHDDELWLLARRAQGAALRLDFELRTALARQVFRRDFVYVSRQLHALEASRRVQGLARACLDDALAAIERRATDVQTLLQCIRTDLQTAIATRAPANASIAFASPARFQATIVSPAAHRYLSLVMQADETLARLEMAWLLGLVEPATRTALAGDCRRALQGFKDLACDRRHAVGEQVREVNIHRKAGTLAHSSAREGDASLAP